jgi:hypothetical protein
MKTFPLAASNDTSKYFRYFEVVFLDLTKVERL